MDKFCESINYSARPPSLGLHFKPSRAKPRRSIVPCHKADNVQTLCPGLGVFLGSGGGWHCDSDGLGIGFRGSQPTLGW